MIYFLTYGDDGFKNSKMRIREEAVGFGLFDDIKIYNREDMSSGFLEKTYPYINIRGGFWLWKSFFLKKTFENMKENDYCIYLDAGCTINPNGKDRFLEYLNMLNDESGILSFKLEWSEEQYTAEKVLRFFNADNRLRKESQLMSTIIILRKCDNTINLIDKYYDIAINETHLFSDIYNNDVDNCSDFIDHRYDQSVFSLLRKKYKTFEIYDETYSADNWDDLIYNKKIPFLSTKIRG